jgi:glutathione S-transferase
MTMARYTLYYFPGNANVAPHVALEEIGLPYALSLVDRKQDAQRSPDYLKLNPNARLPTLIDHERDDLVLFEAAAICLYLSEQHPEAALAPLPDQSDRGPFLQWLIWMTNTLQAEVLLYHYGARNTADPDGAAGIKQRAGERLQAQLDLVARSMADNGGPFLLGARYTIADAYLAMICRWCRMIEPGPRSRAALDHLLNAVIERPAFQRMMAAEGLEAPFAPA